MILLANCPDCIKNNASTIIAQQIDGTTDEVCPTVVHENVCVQGTVTITPNLTSGPSKSICLGNPIIGSCPGQLQRFCSFTVSQNICVQIPLTFSATASAVANGVVCGTTDTDDCPDGNACTHTLGFFRNHSDITNALIAANGGTITLGTGGGLSFVVDTTNANTVLDLQTPTPPAPADPPLHGQYENLYAQLLTAKLNVLSLTALGVDVCAFAAAAIAAADNFLDTSPDGVKDGAPDVKDPLALFNEGKAQGCPFHCND